MALDVESIAIDADWYRHVPHGGDPWWMADPPASGRWQHGADVSGLYLADSPLTAWSEWGRQLAELGLRPEQQLPRDLWRFRVRVDNLADLTDPGRLARVGLGLPRPTRRDWPPFQNVGLQLKAEGFSGVLAASAARPDGGRTLCLFRHDRLIAGVTEIPPPEVHRTPPISAVD